MVVVVVIWFDVVVVLRGCMWGLTLCGLDGWSWIILDWDLVTECFADGIYKRGWLVFFFYSKTTSLNRISNNHYKQIETPEFGHSPSIVENQS